MSDARMAEAVPGPGLYLGRVMHHRLRPFRHRFVYRVFSVLVDLDELDALDRRLRLLSVDRPGILSLRSADHGPRDGSPLRPWVEGELRAAGLGHATARILLFCFPRVLGYVFNPLSLYFAYDAAGHLAAILYEVKNTFGGQHAYVLPIEAMPRGAVHHATDKAFYVSPFIAMGAHYRFKVKGPDEDLSIVIQEDVAEGPQLVASLTAGRRPLSDREIVRALLRDPLMTYKVIVGIHVEALRLWLKGAIFHGRPKPPAPAGDGPGTLPTKARGH